MSGREHEMDGEVRGVLLLCIAACSSSGGQPPSGTPADADVHGLGSGLGPPHFEAGDLDPASNGGTITFQQIGAAGWYPSRRDPAVGPCDARNDGTCCLAKHEVAGDQLTPWDEDLIMTLRGPMIVKQFATYQPDGSGQWVLVSSWEDQARMASGLAFSGNDTEMGFDGSIGTECLVNVSTARGYACGPGSMPFCPASSMAQHDGWRGSKLFVVLATMRHAGEVGGACSDDATGNWYDAPWIGLSHGELVRAGSFSSCQCYAKDPAQWWLADGCGQFNAFEVVNDNNSSKNLGVFSTNFFGYAGYVGEGPCGGACNTSTLAPAVDLIDKANNVEAAMGATATPDRGPRAAFRRPDAGYRYFLILMDVESRTTQLAIVHPDAIPSSIGELLPALPSGVSAAAIDQLTALRLPR